MTHPTPEQVKSYAANYANTSGLNATAKALHVYRDIAGCVLYYRARVKGVDTSGGIDKWVRPFYWSGESFHKGEPPAPPEGKPLYGLDRLAAAPDALVIVTEGESCADALNALKAAGCVAITSGGASSAQAANWQPLTGRRVMVWPDNDTAGANYAADVAEHLNGIAAGVMVLDIAPLNLPAKGDAVDWIQAGGDEAALLVMMAAFTDAAPAGIETRTETVEHTPEPKTEAGTEAEAEILERLASLAPLEYDRQRGKYAELLGVRATALDAQIKAMRKAAHGDEGITLESIEPWSEPIDPAALLSEVAKTIRRFVICQPETADGAALWVAMTWLIDTVQVAPLAVITAPEKRCGKSQLLFLLGRLSCRPLTASNISPAALFRVIDAWKPTLLIDEADAFMRENEELRGLLNCGHTRDSAYTVRIVGEAMTPTRFNVWGAKAIAGIGHLADTLMDRAVALELRRKMPHEVTDKIRHAEPDLFETLAAKFARFAQDYAEAVRQARPELPPSLNDRAQDNWEALLAIADIAGDGWPIRARRAALKLSGADSLGESVGGELLADIRDIFESKHLSRIGTAELITALCDDDEKGWATYNRGKPLTPRQLAKRLNGYGLQSKNIRTYAGQSKGYEFEQFAETFARYLTAQTWDVGRIKQDGTALLSESVPLQAPYSLGWDAGTDTPPLNGKTAKGDEVEL